MPKWFTFLAPTRNAKIAQQSTGVHEAPTRSEAKEMGVKNRPEGMSRAEARKRIRAHGYGDKESQK